MMINILAMPAQIEIYEQMCAISQRMVVAARANDWETLIGLEQSVARLRDTLADESERATDGLPSSERKRELIHRLLKNDAEIRRHTEPWMEQVRMFLTGNSRKQKVDSAYGAS
jgi:flagellar protein FliT